MQPEDVLKKFWNYESFRSSQREIIQAVLAGRDTIALLPTGGGKSLCYQVPALLLDGICIVISPLISLMQDQVKRLDQLGIPAMALHAGLPFRKLEASLHSLQHGPYKLLYISPERLQHWRFRDCLPELNISMIAVDEAHCISQWGHDFRPDYLKIENLRTIFPHVPVLALTASATEEVQEDIAVQLRMKNPQTFRESFRRPNLFYTIRESGNKTGDTLALLQRTPGSTIIYCRSRRQTELLAKSLLSEGVSATSYHAGMSREKRELAQHAWMTNQVRVMVATTAFGMGIDKPDVRLVVHYEIPEHTEAWYQEVGRAGRDGQPAQSVSLYNTSDIRRLHSMLALRYPADAYLRQVYQSVCEYFQLPIGAQPDRYLDFEIGDFCRKFSLQPAAASYALKLLEREGLWTLSESVFHPGTIAFTADRFQTDQVVQAYPDLGIVITGILRNYNNIFHFPVPVRIPQLARQLKLSQDQVLKYLEQLHRMELIEYLPAKDGPQLFFHHLRADSRHLIINWDRINVLRNRDEQRTAAVIELFTRENQCREAFVMQYFGEEQVKTCGHCDACTGNTGGQSGEGSLLAGITALFDNGKSYTLAALLETFPQSNRQSVIALLRGLMDQNKLKRDDNGNFLTVTP